MFDLSSVIAKRGLLRPGLRMPALDRQQVMKLAALSVFVSPAATVAYLFVVNPEALGAPVMKLLLMLGAYCLLMTSKSSSRALAIWAVARWDARPSQPPQREAQRGDLLQA
jgi:hypothetical protein